MPKKRSLEYAKILARIVETAWDKEGIDDVERNRRLDKAELRLKAFNKRKVSKN